MAKMAGTLTYSAGISRMRSQIERALQPGGDESGPIVVSVAQSLEAGRSEEQIRREQEVQAAIGRARRLLEQVATTAGLFMDVGTALRRHLFANGVFRWQYEWRVVAAGLGPWEALREWFTIVGLDKVEQALKGGRGVILANNHFGAGRQVAGVLAHLGFDVLSLEADNLHEAWGAKQPPGLSIVSLKNTFKARAVYQAQKVLQQGGVLHLATDGYTGQHGIELSFLGRKRFIVTTYAELALNTGATVLPVFAPMDEEGRARIEFLDPLDYGNESLDRKQRINQLARHNLALVAARWSTDLGNVMSAPLKKYLNLPVDAAPYSSQR